jgi:hypothetical protein
MDATMDAKIFLGMAIVKRPPTANFVKLTNCHCNVVGVISIARHLSSVIIAAMKTFTPNENTSYMVFVDGRGYAVPYYMVPNLLATGAIIKEFHPGVGWAALGEREARPLKK